MVRTYGRRALLIGGYTLIAIIQAAVGVFSIVSIDAEILLMIAAFNIVFTLTVGPVAWLYASETTCDSTALSICLVTFWSTILILSIACPIIMSPNYLGPIPVFFMFSGFSLIGALYSIIVIKESKGLARNDQKLLYRPKRSRIITEVDAKKLHYGFPQENHEPAFETQPTFIKINTSLPGSFQSNSFDSVPPQSPDLYEHRHSNY